MTNVTSGIEEHVVLPLQGRGKSWSGSGGGAPGYGVLAFQAEDIPWAAVRCDPCGTFLEFYSKTVLVGRVRRGCRTDGLKGLFTR